MSNYSEADFCSPDDGLDYIFARMGAIYGASFVRHFDGIDPDLVRQVWKEELGRFLTYKPSMDYAMRRLSGDFVPSAIKFREFCNAGPHVPRKPEETITHQPNPKMSEAIKREHMAKYAEFKRSMRGVQ